MWWYVTTSIIKLLPSGCWDTTRCVHEWPLLINLFLTYIVQNGTPLKPSQVFQDIPADHAFKTVTIEPFPHSSSLQAALVHPCKHASVMKKIIERMNTATIEEQRRLTGSPPNSKDKDGKKKWSFKRTSGDKAAPSGEEEEVEGIRVDYYLVVFLKFIASIVPTIEVDSTTSL